MIAMEGSETIIQLLSTGVAAAVVAGFFSLAVSLVNSKKLREMERDKREFSFQQARYQKLAEEYDVLTSLPSVLDSVSNNQLEIDDNVMMRTHLIAEERLEMLEGRFRKTEYLFTQDARDEVKAKLAELSDLVSKIRGVLVREGDDIRIDPKQSKQVDRWLHDRLMGIIEFNKWYVDMVMQQLSDIQDVGRH